MRRTVSLVRVLTVLGMALVIIVAGAQHARQAAGQAAGVTSLTVVSLVADDPADPSFQAAYTYLVDAAGTFSGVTSSAGGSETYQIYDGDTGEILKTASVGADGTVTMSFAAGPNRHVINIDDPGDGSAEVSGNSTVMVVINPGFGGTSGGTEPTAAPTSASGTGSRVQVLSVETTDPNDPDFPAEYNYFLSSMPRVLQSHDDLVPSAAGSETYQLDSDADGSILDTGTVDADGSVYFTPRTGVAFHVINADDPGEGTALIPAGDYFPLVTVVINPGASGAQTAGPTAAASTTPSAAASTAPTAAATAATVGNRAAIYAGDCDSDFSDDPVATLTNVAAPSGDQQGAAVVSSVETSFSTLDLSLDDILTDDHVLVVFDKDDDTVPLTCGAIGGVVADDGSLVVALPAVGDSRYAGIAYLAPDGDQTQVTVFLAEDLSGADAAPAA